jgi:hypothetical protein
MRFSNNYNSLIINIENSYLICEKRWLGKTEIVIHNWEKLTVENYVSESHKKIGETFKIDWETEFYEFDMIMEKVICKKKLSLSGFYKHGNGWLTYTFENYKYSIVTEL